MQRRSHGVPSVSDSGRAVGMGGAGVGLLGGETHKGITCVQVPHMQDHHLRVIKQVITQLRVISDVTLPFPPVKPSNTSG